MHPEIEALLTPISRLNRDALKAMRQQGGGVTDSEARYMVDLYYTMQDMRIITGNQTSALDRDAKKTNKTPEPHDSLDWVNTQFRTLEEQIKKILTIYIEQHELYWFFEKTTGIGPVLVAGLLAHIDITKAPTAGHIWSFAGLNPNSEWNKGEKRPFNARLKTICWKIGESFVKTSNHPNGFYGRLYKERKVFEWSRNLSGENTQAASKELNKKKFRNGTDSKAWLTGQCSTELARSMLEEGNTPTMEKCKSEEGTPMLPPAQLHARAKRYAVKLFLSHLQYCWWQQSTGEAPPKPYVIAFGEHAHMIEPPQLISTH